MSSCFLQSSDWVKHLSQNLHLYGFTPVCVSSCRLRCAGMRKNITIIALVWFYSRMCKFMPIAKWWQAKELVTVLALVWFYSWMYKFMQIAIWWQAKKPVTIIAFMRLHSCVNYFMSIPGWWPIKALITIPTLVGYLSIVNQFMLSTNGFLGKVPITVTTLKRSHLVVTGGCCVKLSICLGLLMFSSSSVSILNLANYK